MDAKQKNKKCPHNPRVKCVKMPEDSCGCDPCEVCEVKFKAERVRGLYPPGMFWHVHHSGMLCEYCYSYDERMDSIYRKPGDEILTRKRLLKPVKGELPEEIVTAAKRLAEDPFDIVIYNAYSLTLQRHDKLIDKLHKEECPNCPWFDRTIFPEKL